MMHYLAHAGADHATDVEAAAHASGSSYNWPVIWSVTAVIIFAIVVTVKLLSVAGKPESATKKGKGSK